ncbi:MAG: hypothetical protein HUJ78_06750, partial [Mogibacterium sp.]|nr:hypothetical protein [Mogibacterium sp.]
MNMRIKEKSLTLLLSAAMVLATIPFGSMVAYADAPVTSGLSINAQSVYNAGNTVDYNSTDLASNQSGSGWAWDASSGILTLDGFNGSYIEAIGGITIKLKGTNTLTMAADGPSNGIKATGDIVFEKDSSSSTDKLNVGVSGATALRYMLNTTGTIQINGGSLSLIETGLSGYVAGSDRPVYVNNDANLKASVSFRAVNSAVYCYGKGTVDLECTSTAADSKIVNSIYGNSTAGNEGGQIILSGNGLIANQYADFDTIQN